MICQFHERKTIELMFSVQCSALHGGSTLSHPENSSTGEWSLKYPYGRRCVHGTVFMYAIT